MRIKKFCKDNISKFTTVSVALFIFLLIVKLICVMYSPFADFFNRYISSLSRALFAYITAIFPFSLAETIVICAIPLVLILGGLVIKKVLTTSTPWRPFFNLVGVLLLLGAMFILNFGIAYDCTPLEEKLELDRTVTSEDLLDAGLYASLEVSVLDRTVIRDADGMSVMPYSFDEMTKRLNASYDKLYEEYGFLAPLNVRAKPIALSEPMTYTHISGVYTFFTGEANVNVNYPPYITVFTTAHEMAHQRGVAPEDEANFIAFLVCINSDDEYIRYCGYASILEYIGGALYKSDGEKFMQLYANYPVGLLLEYSAYSRMFAKYSDSAASAVSDAVNDTYLKIQGESAGTLSYDLVTELATAYILKNK